MRKIILTLAFISLKVSAVGTDTFALWSIATNTLNQVRSLNEVISESRKLGENFEKAYALVDQKVLQAERTAYWLEDMERLNRAQIENIDDFTALLAQLKRNLSKLKREMVDLEKEIAESQRVIDDSKHDKKEGVIRSGKYVKEYSSSLTADAAARETANNTKDLLIENAKLNAKLSELTIQIAEMNKRMKEQEQMRLKHEVELRTKNYELENGVIIPADLRVNQ